MQVKVFEAETMPAALAKVKETLGPDALILSTRTLRKNGLGLVGRPRVEITAAIEADDPQPQAVADTYRQAARQPGENKSRTVHEEQISYKDIWKQKKVIDPLEAELHDLREMVARQDVSSLREEIEDLKSVIRNLADKQAEPASAVAAAAVVPGPRCTSSQPQTSSDGHIETLIASLTRHDIAPDTAETLARYAGEQLDLHQFTNQELVNQFVLDTIGDLIKFTPALPKRDGQQRIALVGPTGVGKTTTIAKLAAEYLAGASGSVALFTIDTYRIAAVEQLKVYAGIMDLPVEVIYSPQQMKEAFVRHNDKDLILIDTSGRSHRDEAGMAELSAFLGADASTENHLVLAAGTSSYDLGDIVTSFARMPLHGLIFSKIDECSRRGALLDIPLRRNLPISYLTNGQRVPEDLLAADPRLVAECILGRQ